VTPGRRRRPLPESAQKASPPRKAPCFFCIARRLPASTRRSTSSSPEAPAIAQVRARRPTSASGTRAGCGSRCGSTAIAAPGVGPRLAARHRRTNRTAPSTSPGAPPVAVPWQTADGRRRVAPARRRRRTKRRGRLPVGARVASSTPVASPATDAASCNATCSVWFREQLDAMGCCKHALNNLMRPQAGGAALPDSERAWRRHVLFSFSLCPFARNNAAMAFAKQREL